jgi:hypothetical protein
MASEYILPADYAFYSLPANTAQAQVHAASAVVDGYLQRPAGAEYTLAGQTPTVMKSTGQAIQERREFPRRGELQLSYSPVALVTLIEQRNQGAWVTVSGSYDWSVDGRIWLDNPALNFVGDGDLRVTYLAGWDYASLPAPIKQAVANIIGFSNTANMPGNTKRMKAGDSEIERFDDTAMDGDTRGMLAPYRRVFA